jgi:hypothetical protein
MNGAAVIVHKHMASGVAASDPSSHALACEWMRLFSAASATIRHAGQNPPRP